MSQAKYRDRSAGLTHYLFAPSLRLAFTNNFGVGSLYRLAGSGTGSKLLKKRVSLWVAKPAKSFSESSRCDNACKMPGAASLLHGLVLATILQVWTIGL